MSSKQALIFLTFAACAAPFEESYGDAPGAVDTVDAEAAACTTTVDSLTANTRHRSSKRFSDSDIESLCRGTNTSRPRAKADVTKYDLSRDFACSPQALSTFIDKTYAVRPLDGQGGVRLYMANKDKFDLLQYPFLLIEVRPTQFTLRYAEPYQRRTVVDTKNEFIFDTKLQEVVIDNDAAGNWALRPGPKRAIPEQCAPNAALFQLLKTLLNLKC